MMENFPPAFVKDPKPLVSCFASCLRPESDLNMLLHEIITPFRSFSLAMWKIIPILRNV